MSQKKSLAKKNKKTLTCYLHGHTGRMGQEILRLAHSAADANQSISVTYSEDARSLDLLLLNAADVIIDFTNREGSLSLAKLAKKSLRSKSFLIGSTGLTPKDIKTWEDAAKTGRHLVVLAPNTSLGVYTLAETLAKVSANFVVEGFDVVISETHHNRKKDFPSGTAMMLARSIQEASPNLTIDKSGTGNYQKGVIAMHSIRGGGVVGDHSVRFINEFEEISFAHRAFSRSLFASGALSLARRIRRSKKTGVLRVHDLDE